jgi:hypothetical protein
MSFAVNTSDEFDSWFTRLEEALQDDILFVVRLLQEHGPQLRRPYADTLEGTSLSNLKELRVQHRGEPYRILFAFDPKREALLLIGGNKAGDKRWYKRMIPLAEAIFEKHLETLEKEEGDGKIH